MIPITRREKIYFFAVGLLALWVGLWGYFLPSLVNWAIPWLVPPLHARFLGSMYLSGATFMAGCLLAKRYVEVRVVVPMIAIWTGMLFLISLFYLDEFDYTIPPTYIWFAAYLVYPLIALWLIWKHRGDREQAPGPRLPAWAKAYLLGQGVVAALLALSLLLFTSRMVASWPWKITQLLAQLYSAPFLAYGIGSLLLARQQAWAEVRIALQAMLVFAVGVLLASFLHRSLFSASELPDRLWFGSFIIATLLLGVLSFLAARSEKPAQLEAQEALEKGAF
jgi:hypothetical protein